MQRHLWIIGVLVFLLAMFAGPAAYAQGEGGDQFVFNEAFVLREGETIEGRLAVLRGSVTLEAASLVQQDVAAFGSALTIAGTVRGNVAAFGGTVRLLETAVIEGDFAAFGARVVQAPGAVIRGESVGAARTPADVERPAAPSRRSLISQVISWQLGTLGWALFLAVLGVVAVLLAPRAVGHVASAAAAEPALTFGLGLLTFIVAALGGALLLIACGLGLLVWLALWAATLLGWIGVGLWVGQRLLAALRVQSASALGQVVIGVVLITVLSRLPWCVGFLFSAIAGSIGLGAVIVTRFGRQPSEPSAAPRQPESAPEAALGLEPVVLEAPVALPAPEVFTAPPADAPER